MQVAQVANEVVIHLSWEEAAFILSALDQYVDSGLKPDAFQYEVTARTLFISIDEAFRKKQ